MRSAQSKFSYSRVGHSTLSRILLPLATPTHLGLWDEVVRAEFGRWDGHFVIVIGSTWEIGREILVLLGTRLNQVPLGFGHKLLLGSAEGVQEVETEGMLLILQIFVF